MSENRLVRVAQAAPFKPVREVVDFWVKANRSRPDGATVVDGTVTTVTHAAGKGGSVTEFVLDAAGGHGWPGTRARRDGNEPISAFKGAERVWKFFADKSRASGDAGEQSDSPSGASSDRNASKPSSAGGTAATATPLQVQVLEFPELSNAARRVPIKVHVPASGGPFPVVVISHGAGGDWDTHFAQAQDLAAHGYAVLCLEHIGSNRARLTKGLRPMKNLDAMIRDAGEVLARPKDVRFALDQAQRWNASHEMLKGKFDLGRVGVMGHSFGAFTTMVVCGMRPALDWLVPPVPPGKGLGPDLRDSRVKCGVALSPQGVGEPFFITESFGSLQVPLLGISGTKDDQQAGQPASNRKDAFALWPRGKSQFVWLANAKHLDFTDSTGTDRRELPSATRGDVQPVTRAVTRAFLDLHLKGEGGAAEILTVEGLKPYLRGPIDTVEILSK
jgi:predicted dienelactone hydrolase